MRRRIVTSLAARLNVAADGIGGTAAHQQGGAAFASSTASAPVAAVGRAVAQLSTRAALRPTASAATRLATFQPTIHSQWHAMRDFSAAAAEPEDFDAGLLEDAAADGQAAKFHTAQQAADYVKANIASLTVTDLRSVMQQIVELHFEQLAQRGPRHETTEPMNQIIAAVLEEGSPLRDNGSAVSYLLWGSAKLRLRHDFDREALLAAAVRTLDSCNHKDIAGTIWALGFQRMQPPAEYWERVGERLLGEGLVTYFKVPDLIPALAGMSTMRDISPYIPEFLMIELQQKASALRAREVGGIANFLPNMPSVPIRDELADKVFTQAGRLAPAMNLMGISSVMWGAAKLGYRMEEETLQALLQRVQELLDSNRGHTVPAVLWSLGKQGRRAGDGVVTEEFVRACIASQMAIIDRRVQPHKITKFLNACGMLRVPPTAQEVQACFQSIQDQNYAGLDTGGLEALLRALQGFKFWQGVDAVKAKLGVKIERPRRWGQQQQAAAGEQAAVGEQAAGGEQGPQ